MSKSERTYGVVVERRAQRLNGRPGFSVSWGDPEREYRQSIWFDAEDEEASIKFADAVKGDSAGRDSIDRVVFGRHKPNPSGYHAKAGAASWSGMTPEEKSERARKMVAARWAKRNAAASS